MPLWPLSQGEIEGAVEGFVAMEIAKQIGWSTAAPAPYHFRTHEGDEVDLVLERCSGASSASRSRARRRWAH